DEDVRFYQLGASARLPFSRLLLQEVVLGASAISTTFDPEITTRESFNLSDLYRLEWAVTASPQPPLSLRYAGSFEAWQRPERVARDVARGRFALPFAVTAAQEDFRVLRNGLDIGWKLRTGPRLKLALESAANLGASDDNLAFSVFGSVVLPSPRGVVKERLGIDRFMVGAGYYTIDRFAFLNLNINRAPIGHEGVVIRLMAINDLPGRFFRRLVYGVELNFPEDSEFAASFGDSIRYFVALNFDTGWL
ncbi:MAG: hypothetical protein ACE5HK_04430, partial [Candidatus Methylomirabilales bacterium]